MTGKSRAAGSERFALPPLELAERSGPLRGDPADPALSVYRELDWWRPEDPLERYQRLGATVRGEVLAALPASWSLAQGRMLDFGCATGRVMRHFSAEAEQGEVWGCDVHAASIRWARDNLCPPFHVVENGPEPPLPFPDDHFDLVLALSVFTHISAGWSSWLLEIRRVLKPGGFLFASFLGRGAFGWEQLDDDWDEDRHGINVLHPWNPIEAGGPNVYHSTWWLQAHWGRAFEILELQPDGLAFPPGHGHGWVLLRPSPGELTTDDLDRDEPEERREWRSRQHNWRQVSAQGRSLHAASRRAEEAVLAASQRAEEAEWDSEALRAALEAIKRSLSWRLTRPLRAARGAIRRRRVR